MDHQDIPPTATHPKVLTGAIAAVVAAGALAFPWFSVSRG